MISLLIIVINIVQIGAVGCVVREKNNCQFEINWHLRINCFTADKLGHHSNRYHVEWMCDDDTRRMKYQITFQTFHKTSVAIWKCKNEQALKRKSVLSNHVWWITIPRQWDLHHLCFHSHRFHQDLIYRQHVYYQLHPQSNRPISASSHDNIQTNRPLF